LLHDNEDGTFSVRGVYAPLRREGSQVSSPRQPAVVVSQGPTDFSDPSEMIPPWEANDDESGPTSATPDEKDPQVLDRGLEMGAGLTGEALWSYLQPHLVKHKGPDVPSKGWVRELLPLHQIREPDWNTIWLADHPFCDSQPRDVSALIIQVTGDLAPTPCARCREGKGPFASCVMISTKAHSDPLKTIFGCSNCFYHYRQTYCTNKEWGATRAKEILQGRRGHSRPKVKPPASEEGIRGDDKLEQEVKIQDMSTIDDDNMEHYMNDSTADTPPTSGSAPTSIREAEPGRPYTMWPGKNEALSSKHPTGTNKLHLDDTGCLATMSGALLPIGYQLDRTIPRRPWVCPVRTCRKAFGKRSDLGFHFPVWLSFSDR
jgi:hypothetical protein